MPFAVAKTRMEGDSRFSVKIFPNAHAQVPRTQTASGVDLRKTFPEPRNCEQHLHTHCDCYTPAFQSFAKLWSGSASPSCRHCPKKRFLGPSSACSKAGTLTVSTIRDAPSSAKMESQKTSSDARRRPRRRKRRLSTTPLPFSVNHPLPSPPPSRRSVRPLRASHVGMLALAMGSAA